MVKMVDCKKSRLFICLNNLDQKEELLLLMSVFSKTLLTLMRRHLMSFSFLSAWHTLEILII